MKHILQLLLFCGFALLLHGSDGLPPERFLEELRRPLASDAWGEYTGRITNVRNGKRTSGNLRVRVTFTPDSMMAQLTLNDNNTYGLEQYHQPGQPVKQVLDMPDKEIKPGLSDFGVAPGDLSFSFLYWDFVKELPERASRWRDCRVLKLASPAKDGSTVEVWFDKSYGFPMEAHWFRAGDDKPWRTLVMQGAKRFENGLWFVKEMRIEGDGWKTQVKFDFADRNEIRALPNPAK